MQYNWYVHINRRRCQSLCVRAYILKWTSGSRTYEVEVGLAAERMRQQPDHLVQRQPAIDHKRRLRHGRHVRVHLLIHQPEGDGFIAHQRLVM